MIGYSTGAIAKSNLKLAEERIISYGLKSIEYSALRFHELEPAISFLLNTPLINFLSYYSFHAPSKFSSLEELKLINNLSFLCNRLPINIILHPDSLHNWELWKPIEQFLCFENMDPSKSFGTSVQDLSSVFNYFPLSGFCFDIAHAYKIDPSLKLAKDLTFKFSERLRQVHISELDHNNHHIGLSEKSLLDYQSLQPLFNHIPIILETVVLSNEIATQIKLVKTLIQ